jgi:hypothetical protein
VVHVWSCSSSYSRPKPRQPVACWWRSCRRTRWRRALARAAPKPTDCWSCCRERPHHGNPVGVLSVRAVTSSACNSATSHRRRQAGCPSRNDQSERWLRIHAARCLCGVHLGVAVVRQRGLQFGVSSRAWVWSVAVSSALATTWPLLLIAGTYWTWSGDPESSQVWLRRSPMLERTIRGVLVRGAALLTLLTVTSRLMR